MKFRFLLPLAFLLFSCSPKQSADPKYEEYKDFAENWLCNQLKGGEFKACVKGAIEEQELQGKSGYELLDEIPSGY